MEYLFIFVFKSALQFHPFSFLDSSVWLLHYSHFHLKMLQNYFLSFDVPFLASTLYDFPSHTYFPFDDLCIYEHYILFSNIFKCKEI